MDLPRSLVKENHLNLNKALLIIRLQSEVSAPNVICLLTETDTENFILYPCRSL
jgi:hypothetical protein